MDLCTGKTHQKLEKINYFERVSVEYVFPISFFTELALSLIMTWYIFFKRNSSQRPIFVTLQFALLFLSNAFYCTVTVLQLIKYEQFKDLDISKFQQIPQYLQFLREHNPRTTLNILFTFGDLFVCLYDWILTEQLFLASLSLPTATCGLNENDESRARRKRSVKYAHRIANFVLYSLTASWFIITLIKQQSLVRLSLNFIFCY